MSGLLVFYAGPSRAEGKRTAINREFETLVVLKTLDLPAASTAAATTPAPAVASAISATTSAIASATSGVFSLWAGLVHVKRTSSYLRAVQCGDGLFPVFITGHFHKAESAGASGIAVGHDADPIYLSVRLEHLAQFVFRCVKAQVANENILHASSSAVSCRSCELDAADRQVGENLPENRDRSWRTVQMRHEV
jgi:hypothetical protein